MIKNPIKHKLLIIKNLLLSNFITFVIWLVFYVSWMIILSYSKNQFDEATATAFAIGITFFTAIATIAFITSIVLYIITIVLIVKFRAQENNLSFLKLAYIPIINLFIFFPLITSKKYKEIINFDSFI